LPNFSAYPFENLLQSLKKLLRKSNQALQQVIKRLMERFHIDEVSPKTCYDKRQFRFKLQHDSGPLLPNMIRSSKQYKELHFGPWYLSCKIPNNCVYLTSDPPLKETVLGVFDLAEIVAGGSKNKQIDGFCAKCFA
jgi:hypothetical protein